MMANATLLPRGERYAAGRLLRRTAKRRSHAGWQPAADRADPVAILEAQGAGRIPELLPIRYGRMEASPLAFLRGAAAVMAADLASTAATGLAVQSCGDCHLANFGSYRDARRAGGVRHQRFRRDAAGAVRVGPQAAGHQPRSERPRERLA